MDEPADATLEDRIENLSRRIDESLARVQRWISPLEIGTRGEGRQLGRLRAILKQAEAKAALEAQRCATLEDRLVELEAALVGAREARAHAEAVAEHAQHEASLAFDQLESAGSESAGPSNLDLGATLQEKLLEIERLTRERDGLRSASGEWRGKAQAYRRERDEATLALSRTTSELDDLREREAAARAKLGELERRVAEQARELEVAARRAEHLREHFNSGPR